MVSFLIFENISSIRVLKRLESSKVSFDNVFEINACKISLPEHFEIEKIAINLVMKEIYKSLEKGKSTSTTT